MISRWRSLRMSSLGSSSLTADLLEISLERCLIYMQAMGALALAIAFDHPLINRLHGPMLEAVLCGVLCGALSHIRPQAEELVRPIQDAEQSQPTILMEWSLADERLKVMGHRLRRGSC